MNEPAKPVPCPFCGCLYVRVYISPGIVDDEVWDVGCVKCSARMQAFKTQAAAIAAWNTRQKEPASE